MTPTAHLILDELLAAVSQMSAVYADPVVIPFGRDRVRQKVVAIAEKLAVEKARPMSEVIAPYAPWNGITR